jgi:hypothetical protein
LVLLLTFPFSHLQRQPSEVYFKAIFADLPVIAPNVKVPKPLLLELGVREFLELKLVFERLQELDWDYVKLVSRYLVKQAYGVLLSFCFP